MDRREFLKTAAATAAFAAIATKLPGGKLIASETETAGKTDLVAVRNGEPVAMFRRGIEALGGMASFVKPGQSVVVKPNIGWDRSPELAGNTNPKLVKALVKKCLEAGASKVTVFDHTCDNWQKCYETSGIAEAVKEAGGIIMPANDEKYFKEVSIPGGVNLKSAKIHEALIEADAWINVPVLKNHGGAKMTCAMKNYMGIVWDRRFFHQNDLQQCIADICTWQKKPVLNIVDAYRIMHQNGPQGKSAADVATLKSLIASPNIVAIDTAALRLFNQVKKLDMAAVGHIGKGEALKLGTTNLDNVTIKRIKI